MDDIAKFMMDSIPVQAGSRAAAHLALHPPAKRAKASDNEAVIDLTVMQPPAPMLSSSVGRGSSSSSSALVDWAARQEDEEREFDSWITEGMKDAEKREAERMEAEQMEAETEKLFEDFFDDPPDLFGRRRRPSAADESQMEAETPGAERPSTLAKPPTPAKPPTIAKPPTVAADAPPTVVAADAPPYVADEPLTFSKPVTFANPVWPAVVAEKGKKSKAASSQGVSDTDVAKSGRLAALTLARPELFSKSTLEEISLLGEWYEANKQVLSELPRSAFPCPLHHHGSKCYTLILSSAKVTIRLNTGTFYIKPVEPWCAEWGCARDKTGGVTMTWRKCGSNMAWMIARLCAGEEDGLDRQRLGRIA
jgi:hypothetical protein